MTYALKTVWFGGETQDSVPAYPTVLFYDGSTYTDETADAATTASSDVGTALSVGDIFYFGHDRMFDAVRAVVGAATTGMVGVWEYQDVGGSWQPLNGKSVQTGSANLAGVAASVHILYWHPWNMDGAPDLASATGWFQGTVNGVTKYWVRFRITTAPSAAGTFTSIDIAPLMEYEVTFRLPEPGSMILDGGMIWSARLGVAASINRQSFYAQLSNGSETYGPARLRQDAVAVPTTGENLTISVEEEFGWLFGTEDPQAIILGDSNGQWASNQSTTDITWKFWVGMLLTTAAANATTNAIQAFTPRMWLTYMYDDSATTQLKTVMIPMEPNASGITTTLAIQGTYQIPPLDTFCPEASKTFKDIHLLIQGNTTAGSGATFNLTVDAGDDNPTSSRVLGVSALDNAGATGTFDTYIASWTNDIQTQMDHQVRARTSLAAASFKFLSMVLIVTYEFNASTTTRVLNSIQIPMLEEPGYIGGSSTYQGFENKDLWIAEPGTIEPRQSAICFSFADPAALGSVVPRFGWNLHNSSVQEFASLGSRTFTAPSNTAGMITAQWRIDDKQDIWTNPVMNEIQRGHNRLQVTWYGTAGTGGGTTALLYLNYESDKASRMGKHVRTLRTTRVAPQSSLVITNFRYDLPGPYIEPDRFLVAMGYEIRSVAAAATRSYVLRMAPSFADDTAFSDDGLGWRPLFSQYIRTDAERGIHIMWVRGRNEFVRWTGDPQENVREGRVPMNSHEDSTKTFALDCSEAALSSAVEMHTYHCHTFTVSGTVSGYTGTGAGITVDIFRANTDEKVLTLTTTTGGAYTGTWYDSAEPLYAVARQDATHLGRSNDFYAV